ncbi:MFS transporter [Terasakiella sp. A23]|uniref:MFS transporter n=1 Tax=Terasakiella sp. FCG-A23 TaxID=3080561 RepID=UPI002953E2AB|nr:MFS transporter [Terasakiella sp. A23]MDV7340931.1 MFS transporter [Terasakiella sp. A23]
MQKIISPFIFLFVSVWLINLGGGLQGTLLGMRATLESFDVTETGIVMSSYFIGYIISIMIVPRFINAVGHIRSFAAFASLCSAVTLSHAVFVDPVSWFVFRSITGVCFGGLVLIVESWLNASVSNENRGTVFASYMLVIFSAAAISQTLLNLTSIQGYDLFVLVSVILSLSVLPLSLGKRIHAPEIKTAQRKPLLLMLKHHPLGTLGVFVAGLLSGALWAMTPVFMIRSDYAASEVSIAMFCLMVGGTLAFWPIGKLSDMIDRRKVILGLTVMTFVVSITHFLAGSSSPSLFYVLVGLLGFVSFPIYAVCASHINDYLEADEFISACSTMVVLYGCGAFLAPLLSSTFMSFFGVDGFFAYLATAQIPLIAFATYRIAKKDVLAAEDRTDFVYDVPKVTPTVNPLDPRNVEIED